MNLENESAQQTGLYIHIPFCEKKCPYCDFNTYAGLESYFDDTVDALCREMVGWSTQLKQRQISTVFLGGGTPSALSLPQLERIFETLHRHYKLSIDCEITSEVNPGTVDRSKFAGLRSLGVNRLSMGVQSFQESELKFLGRIHNTKDVYAAYSSARAVGFENINLDFIFGLPEQKNSSWQDTLEQAIKLAPDHLSLYSLIVEPNTVLNHWVQTGKTPSPDEDEAATQYKSAIEELAVAGYTHYEVSNWSRSPELACQHNLIYWRNNDYLGIGPGAHSHLRYTPAVLALQQTNPQLSHMLHGQQGNRQPNEVDESGELDASSWIELRWGNRKPVPGYVKRVTSLEPTGEFFENPSSPVAMGETMMLGLRLLREGVPYSRFNRFHNADLRKVYAAEIHELIDLGYVQLDEERIRLTRAGLMVGNQIFYRFLSNN